MSSTALGPAAGFPGAFASGPASTLASLGRGGSFVVSVPGVALRFAYVGYRVIAPLCGLAVQLLVRSTGIALGPLSTWVFPDPGLAALPNNLTLIDRGGTSLNAGAVPVLTGTMGFQGTVAGVAPPWPGAVGLLRDNVTAGSAKGFVNTSYSIVPGTCIAVVNEVAGQDISEFVLIMVEAPTPPLAPE